MADAGNATLAGDPPQVHRSAPQTVTETLGIVRLRRGPTQAGIDGRRMHEETDGGTRRGMSMAHVERNRQDDILPVQRLANDAREKAGGGLVGFARPDADGRKADPDAVEEAAPRIVGQQQLADGLLRAIAREGRQKELVADGLREWRSEYRRWTM